MKRTVIHKVTAAIMLATLITPPHIVAGWKPRINISVPPVIDHAAERAREAAARAARETQRAARRAEEAKREAAARAARAAREAARAAQRQAEHRAEQVRKAAEDAARMAENAKREAERRAAEVRKAAEEAAKRKAEQLRDEAERAKRSVTVELSNLGELAQDRTETLRNAAIAESRNAFVLKNWEQWTKDPGQTLLGALSRGEQSLRVEMGRGVEYLKDQWWYTGAQKHLLKQFLEEPQVIVCREELPGPPVVYVNGVFTPKNAAIKAGNAIAQQLQRRVHVLHNPTILEGHTGLCSRGFGNDDLSESVYDRTWPALVVSRLDSMTEALLSGLVGGDRLQGNPTTRQLAHILYHAEEPVSLITHSQGCLIARNAFFTLGLLGKETKARSDIAWVAAGLPLNDNEIWPEPKRMTILDYRDDPIAKLVGLRGGGLTYNGADHAFIDHYVPQLDPRQIWPGQATAAGK